MAINIPYLDYNALQKASHEFLSSYHPNGGVPLPIEEIVELELKLNVVPVPGLSEVFQLHGYISKDLTTIYVDQSDLERNVPRFRFTLAHEIGHYFLHRQVFEQLNFDTVEEWMNCVNQLSSKDNSFLEYHANVFAGLILVPDQELAGAWNEAGVMAGQEGLSAADPQVRDYMVSWLAKKFFVSTAVVLKRLEKAGL